MAADPVAQEFTDSMDIGSEHIVPPAGGEDLPEDCVLVRLSGTDRYMVVRRGVYVEQLEQAVLKMWCDDEKGMTEYCRECDDRNRTRNMHAPDCIVPALEAKYAL